MGEHYCMYKDGMCELDIDEAYQQGRADAFEWRTDRPTEEGLYLVTVAIPQNAKLDSKGERFESVDSYIFELAIRYFGKGPVWPMYGEPHGDDEFAWCEECGSSFGEKVVAWTELPRRYDPEEKITWEETNGN